MKFNKARYKVLHQGQGNLQYQKSLEEQGIESTPVENDLDILVDKTLDISQKCALPAQKANCICACIWRGMSHQTHHRVPWSSQYKTDMDLGPVRTGSEEVHEGDQKAGAFLLGRQADRLGLFSLDKTRLQWDHIVAFQ